MWGVLVSWEASRVRQSDSQSVSQSACVAFASVRQPSTNHGNVEGNVYASSCRFHSPPPLPHHTMPCHNRARPLSAEAASLCTLSPRLAAFSSQFAVRSSRDSRLKSVPSVFRGFVNVDNCATFVVCFVTLHGARKRQ